MPWEVVTLAFLKQGVGFISAVAWPTAAVVISRRFKEPITKLLDRMNSFEAFGVRAQLPTAAQEAPAALAAPAEELPAAAVNLPPYDPVLTEFDQGLIKGLKNLGGSAETQLDWVVRIASSNWLNWRHEAHYRMIYGSQIRALKVLASEGPRPAEWFQAYFSAGAHSALGQVVGYTFPAWINWLQNTGDIRYSDSGLYDITPLGRSFLAWIPTAGVSEAKLF